MKRRRGFQKFISLLSSGCNSGSARKRSIATNDVECKQLSGEKSRANLSEPCTLLQWEFRYRSSLIAVIYDSFGWNGMAQLMVRLLD